MKKIMIAAIIAMFLLPAGTAISMGRHGEAPGVDVRVRIPVLPSLVILEAEPYYYQSDYHYHYNNDRWYYSKSRQGPWAELPRDHYPKEIKYKGKDGKHYSKRDERDRYDRDHDKRGRNNHGRDDNRRDDNRGRDDNQGRNDNNGRDNRNDDRDNHNRR